MASSICARRSPYSFFDQPPFEIGREAFVEPEVVPGRIRDQVAGPGMREFVHDHGDETAIAGDDRRRDERKPRVFHAAEWEALRHDQEFVAVPAVGPDHLLAGVEHASAGRRTPGGRVESRGLGPHARPVAETAELRGRRPRARSGTAGSAASSRTRYSPVVLRLLDARRAHHRDEFGRRADARRRRSRARAGVSCSGIQLRAWIAWPWL